MFLMKITPAMYGKTYCSCITMAWGTALGNVLSVMIHMIVYFYACCWKHFNGFMYVQSSLAITRPVITLIGCNAVGRASRFFGR